MLQVLQSPLSFPAFQFRTAIPNPVGFYDKVESVLILRIQINR